MKQHFKKAPILTAASLILASLSAKGANTFYAAGDLVLFFQQAGGTNTVYANLGNAATLYRGSAAGAADGANSINMMDLSSTLASAFGAEWASDPTVYAGLAGVFSTSATTTVLTNGDPSRTLYVSASRESIGTVGEANSAGYTVNTNTGMTNGASGITQQNNAFETNYDSMITISPTSISTIDDMNPISPEGLQGTAMNIFGGGIQQQGQAGSFGSYGDAGSTEFALDLYRIVARNDLSGQVAGDVRTGSYEGTVTVGTNGMVSFVAVPEPSAVTLAGLAASALVLRRRRNA
jgi:hypothetical protein